MSSLTTGRLFSKELLIKRVDNTIPQFFDQLKDVCKTYKWQYTDPVIKKDLWENNMVRIKRENHLQFEVVYKVPSLVSKRQVGWEHVLEIKLPKEYPHNLNKTKLNMRTKLFHPREHGKWMCITINGEIDRILMDYMFHLLWDDTKVYADYNRNKYEGYKDDEVFNWLMKEMKSKYGTDKPTKPKGRVIILE